MTQINRQADSSQRNRWFFGYGSLVNRSTHSHGGAHPARLGGWRRAWRQTTLRPLAFLTVVPDPDAEIDGLIAPVPGHGWAALDERERGYDRVPAAHQVTHALSLTPEIVVYAIPENRNDPQGHAAPVLLSYLDTVIQGYLREFGEDGAWRFFATTNGWDAPIIDDRAAPGYLRACRPSLQERAFVDDALHKIGVRPVPAA